MKDNKNNFFAIWVPIIVIILLFIFVSYITQQYSEQIQEVIQQNNAFAILAYLSILITAIVFVPLPINTMLIVPIASNAWGAFLTGLLSVIGWTTGAMISFILARKYGRPLVSRFVSFDKIEQIEKRIPDDNLFWSVVILRIAMPVDLLSYALGLFTTMSKMKYFLATVIGVIPFAFLLSYAGTFSLWYQLVVLSIASIIFLSVYHFIKRDK